MPNSTIFKYSLDPTGSFIYLPAGAKILTVQVQNNQPCIWAEVDPTNYTVKRDISIIGTGHTLPKKEVTYIGTFQLFGGDLVFHVYIDIE